MQADGICYKINSINIICQEAFHIQNPFYTDKVLGTNASINKLIIERMPECSVTQNLTGKCAQEVFSTDLLIQAIKASSSQLKIDICGLEEKSLPTVLEHCLLSGDKDVREQARYLLKLFGERLAVILLCLKEGSPENRAARPDWSAAHWAYWNSLRLVILVGGLASPPLGEHLKYYVEQIFDRSGKAPYQIIIGPDSTYAGIRGCAAFLLTGNKTPYISTASAGLIFDYGQSFIKRSYVITEHEKIKDIIPLKKKLAKHVEWDLRDKDKEEREAVLLDNYFVGIIEDTIAEVEDTGFLLNTHIVISIANYVRAGMIANRGGYGKLRLIAPDYAEYLKARLKKLKGRDFHFTLIHDGTAMAAGYAEYKNAVCISLGTAFGVGFPDCFE